MGTFPDQGITMGLPMFRIASGFLPVNLAACSARAQSIRNAAPRSSPVLNGWHRVLAAGRFVHLTLLGGGVARTKP